MTKTNLIWLAAALGLTGLLLWLARPPQPDPGQMASIKIPALSMTARQGQQKFLANCAVCHGQNATGTKQGPPLVHSIYRPAHHADASFYRAVQLGVRAHHWGFGNMPPISGVTREDVTLIIRYIRELQRANGIY